MRYLSHNQEDIERMLEVIGVNSIDELFRSIPESLRFRGELELPEVMSEWDLEHYLRDISSGNPNEISFLGGGIYNHFIPYIIPYLASRSEFLTAYTPYQPEISQGTLQVLFEFQTYISRYLGMDYANASMYDGATSFVEALMLSVRVTKRDKVLVSKAINPNYLEVLETYAEGAGIKVEYLDVIDGKTTLDGITDLSDTASIAIQSPNFYGVIEDQELVKPIIGDEKTLFISLFSEIMSFGLYKSPGEYGADIACGEAQSFGIDQSFGGPCLGVFAFNKKYLRSVPGRLAGETVDRDGKRAFSLTLATREQHIRREKATSNICSNQGLCVVKALIYMSLNGFNGIRKVAEVCYSGAEYLKDGLRSKGVRIIHEQETFNEFLISLPEGVTEETFIEHGINPGLKVGKNYLVTVTELHTKENLDLYISIIGGQK